MAFQGKQKTFTYQQVNHAHPDKVFPLLCPVREADWLDGWQYNMIYSKSGLIEKDCVFTTPHHGELVTAWQVTQHDPSQHFVEFVRLTPNENVVKIQIQLALRTDNWTDAHITYQYTGLNPQQNDFIENELEQNFLASMQWWEKAINHYLTSGEMLRKEG
jgi:hypothetical protein